MAVVTEQASFGKKANVSGSGAKDLKKTPSIEEYVGTLLSRIQPAAASEDRRSTVAEYVKAKIAQAFQPSVEVKAFPYGSVPLKTYLPDGDIDLAIFPHKGSSHQLKENWFTRLSESLKAEAINPVAPYRVRDVQVIHAEVKLVKCLVDNIVVDISYQSLGGLYTVNFLESIDRRIDDHHLFKRSIILVKAWCYYESRLLGAHHGLISTYALETMVLYIFMVYHKSVTTPLKVLHKFLTVFSKFDWDNQCLSLRGPIPLSTFPDPKPLPFPDMKDPPLLKEDFMADMRHMYSPPGLTTEAPSTAPKAFHLKFLNIMDPLLPTNNLGRSVNKSSFARIRRALEYGAKRLDTILQQQDQAHDLDAFKSFFQNTWNAQRSQAQGATSTNKFQPYHMPPSVDPQRVIPAVHVGQTAMKGPLSHAAHHSMSLPATWQTLQGQQAGLHPRQLQQMMLHQHNQALYRHLLYPSVSVDNSNRALKTSHIAAGESQGEHLRPWSAQMNQEGRGHLPSLREKSAAPVNAKQSSQHHGNGIQAQKKAMPSKPASEDSQSEEQRRPANDGTLREAVQQLVFSHSPVYASVMPGMPHTLHPVVSSLPVAGYYPDYYKALHPQMPQNSSLYNLSRVPAGYLQPQGGSATHSTNGMSGKGEQREGDLKEPASKAAEQRADILAGNLEQLSQQLQSAAAMFNSHSAQSSAQRLPGNSTAQGNAQARGGASDGLRPPMRSSSMGSLNPHIKPSPQLGNMRWQKQDMLNGSLDSTMPQIPHHPGGASSRARPRYNGMANGSVAGDHAPSNGPGLERLGEGRLSLSSDRGSSQPSSPGLRQLQASLPAGVPHPFNSVTAADWPLLSGKVRPPTEYTEGLRWGSQSEGQPGWASPAGSVVSEQSLASLKAMRANGASPPPLSSVSPVPTNDTMEAHQREAGIGPPNSKTWREDFVLAEEDFPGLPSSTPQSRNATPTKDKPAPPHPVSQWRPESRLPSMTDVVPTSKSSSQPVR